MRGAALLPGRSIVLCCVSPRACFPSAVFLQFGDVLDGGTVLRVARSAVRQGHPVSTELIKLSHQALQEVGRTASIIRSQVNSFM